jgi:hypothetical protein
MTKRLQVVIPMDDELPLNYATNTFHFEAVNDLTVMTAISDAVDSLYDNAASWLSSLITPATWTHKWFDLEDPEPRVPIFEFTGRGPVATGSTAAPPELALCISWKAEPSSGFPAGRLRNRIYVGPFTNAACGSDGRPATTLVTNLKNSGDLLLEASKAATWKWVVYSPTQAAASAVASFDIMEGWVDNEFDIQRRRGRRGTARETFS